MCTYIYIIDTLLNCIHVWWCMYIVNSRCNHQSAKIWFRQDVCHINDPWKHAPSMCKGLQTQNSNSTTRLETYNWQILIFGVKAKTCSWPWAFHGLPVPSFPFLSYISYRLIEIRRFARGRFVMVCACTYPHTGTQVKQTQFEMASMAKLMKANTLPCCHHKPWLQFSAGS